MNKLRTLRKKKDLTLDEVGKQVFLSRSVVGRLESGKMTLTEDYIKKFCQFYNVSSDYLLGYTEIPRSEPSLKANAIYYGGDPDKLTHEQIRAIENMYFFYIRHNKRTFGDTPDND